jgi:hypothetical protein
VSYVYGPAGTPLSSYWRRRSDAATPAPKATPSATPTPTPERAPEPKSLQRLPAGRLGFRSGPCSLELTDGWESVEQGLLLGSLGASSLRLYDVQPRVTLVAFAARLHRGVTLDDYVRNSHLAYQSLWKIEEDAIDTLGAVQARRLIIRQSVPGDDARLLEYYMAPDQEHAIVLTFVARPPDAFATHQSEFESIARSVRIERPLVDEA